MALKRNHWGDTTVEVTVRRLDLIERLKQNKEKHKHNFDRAIALWQQHLAELLVSIDTQKIVSFPRQLSVMEEQCPKSYLSDYEDIIEMFEMGVHDTVLLDAEAFRKFCKDEWDWKNDISGNHYYRLVKQLDEQNTLPTDLS